MFTKYFTPEQAFQKAKHFCSYQDRSHYEVREKLYSFGLNKQEVELLLTQLIEEDYLNELRFAEQFAGGKFRIKHWGKLKITYELKNKRIGDYIIKKALLVIDDEAYQLALLKQATKKWNSLTKDTPIVKLTKTTAFLMHKGFENNLIKSVLINLKTEKPT